jgi:hypothetical protein
MNMRFTGSRLDFPTLTFFLLLCGLLSADLPAEEELKCIARRATEAVQVDGLLAEPAWQNAPELNTLLEIPSDRENSSQVATTVKVLYDDRYLYFGFFCRDENPDRILTHISERDQDIRVDDSVYILIDTLRDGQNYYYLGTNVFGTLFDGTITRDGRSSDPSWDAAWTARGQRNESGWSAEIAVEFSSLDFDPEREKNLALSTSRIVPRLDSVLWSGPLHPAFEDYQFSQLHPIDLEDETQIFQVVPYALAGGNSRGSLNQGIGLDMSYNFSPQTYGQLSVNPEFFSAEPDREQPNLTPYELYLPEKRDFFTQGSGLFQQDIQLFYSKRIGDIYGGIKLAGTSGSFDYAGFSTQSKKDADWGQESANISALRLYRRLGQKLGLGLTASNLLREGQNTGAAGVDAEYRLSKRIALHSQLALSYGEYAGDNLAFRLGSNYQSTRVQAHLDYLHLGRRFGDNANSVGYVPDDNRHEVDGSFAIIFPFRDKPVDQLRYSSNYNAYWGIDGTLRSWQVDQAAALSFKQKWTILLHHTQEYKLNEGFVAPIKTFITVPNPEGFVDVVTEWDPELQEWVTYYKKSVSSQILVLQPIKDLRNHRTKVESAFYTGPGSAFNLSITMGRHYTSGFYIMALAKDLQIGSKLSVQYDLQFVRFYRNLEPLFLRKTTYHMLKGSYQISRQWSAAFFAQVNSAIQKIALHAVASYTFVPPWGRLQIIYQKGNSPLGLPSDQDHTLYLKVAYLF